MKQTSRTLTLLLTAAAAISASAAAPLAFPGAEGYGRHTAGGRGGRIIKVTNLNDSGPGSLRNAVEATGPRTVVFDIDGTIELLSPLRINNDSITIAGQSAPADGICLKDYPLVINASEVIIRHIRVRPGDRHNLDSDGIGGGRYGQRNVILDHCSVSWSIDECLSIYKTENLTVQWCLISHSLNSSVHTKGSHGFGGIWGGYKATFHHNLLANHASRNPRFSSVDGTKWVDFRNNVVYNWGFKTAYGGGHHAEINMVANYYKPGPASQHSRLLDVADDATGRYYVAANHIEGSPPSHRRQPSGRHRPPRQTLHAPPPQHTPRSRHQPRSHPTARLRSLHMPGQLTLPLRDDQRRQPRRSLPQSARPGRLQFRARQLRQ